MSEEKKNDGRIAARRKLAEIRKRVAERKAARKKAPTKAELTKSPKAEG